MSVQTKYSMAKELKLEEEGFSIWWLDVHSENKGLKEIQTDLNAPRMAMFVDSSKEVYVCIRVTNASNDHGCGPGGISDHAGGLGGNNDHGDDHG